MLLGFNLTLPEAVNAVRDIACKRLPLPDAFITNLIWFAAVGEV